MQSTRCRILFVLPLLVLCLAAGQALAAGNVHEAGAADGKGRSWIGRQLSHFKAYPHLDMAYRRMKENRPEEAQKEFELYLRIQPDDLAARGDYMNLLYDLGRYDAAMAEAHRILAAKPDDASALLTSGLCLMRAGDLKSAVAPMEQAVALTKDKPVPHRVAVLATADVLAKLGRLQEALSLLSGLPETEGDYALKQAKGVLWAKSGDNARAIQAFTHALAAAGNDKEKLATLRALAVASADAGEAQKAGAYLTEAQRLAPGDPVLLHQQAVLANKAGRFEEAARLGQELTRLAPTLENKLFLANVLASLKRYDAAAAELTPLLAQKPKPKEAYRLNMRLGVLAMQAGKPNEAAAYFRAAVDLRREPLALVRLSRAEQRAGRTLEAAQALHEAVSMGADPDTLLELATLLTKLDKNTAAITYLDKALAEAKDPAQRSRILAMKATLLAETGDNAAARKVLEEALKAPGADKARLLAQLGETCLRLGDAPAAVAAFTQALSAGAGQDIQASLAEALVRDGQAERALGIYKTLVEKAATPQKRATYRLAVANLLSRLGRNAEAAPIFQELAASGQPALLRQAGESFAAADMDKDAIASLEAFTRQDVSPADKAEALLALGNVYASRKNAAKAYDAFDQASRLASNLPRDKQAEIALGLGTAAALSGRPAKAIEPLTRALGLMDNGPRKAKAIMTLAQAYGTLGNSPKAIAFWRQAAAAPGALRSDIAASEESLGYALTRAGDLPAAEKAFRRALVLSGPNWRVLSALGQIAYTTGRYQEGLDAFSQSLALHPDPATRIAMARCYEKLGKPGLALVDFDKATPDISSLSPQDRRAYYRAKGFLYAGESRNEAGIAAFKATLALGYDPETATRLGRLERLAGHPEEAKKTLEAVDPATLPPDLQVLRLSELASLAEAQKDYDTARKFLEASLAIKPDADTEFRLGNVLRDSHHVKEAIEAYRRAVKLDDANRYLTALGYALSEDKQYAAAADVFETVLHRDPDYLHLWEDLGYAYMHECDNNKSVDRFKRAIDNAPLRPVDSPQDREKLDKDVYRMRKEVTKLETHFTTTAYMSYIAGDAGPLPSSGGDSMDTIRSGAGAEFAWIPPKVGFRDDRILQVIGRATASFNKDSLEIDDTSWQGAAGLRYKPFKTQNLNVGVERLFKLGKAAEDNWLLRAMYSLTDGYDVKPKEKYWNYSYLYGEYDYYTENDPRSMFYIEGRQGISFNVRDRFLITPHVVADVRVWSPDLNESSYVEGGGGLSFKYLFNRADYEVERSSLEFLLQYKYGTLFNKTKITDRENVINALFLTTILKF